MEFYPGHEPPPEETRTARLLLRPLRTADVELDYDAVVSSAEQLRRWSQTEWPADDFTLAENLRDLERHEREHIDHVAFTFTVLSPMASRCLGCTYITPVPEPVAGYLADASCAANVGFWVRTADIASDLDRHLLSTLRVWLAAEWPFDRVAFSISDQDSRQAVLLREAGLEQHPSYSLPDGRVCRVFLSGPRQRAVGTASVIAQ